MINIIYRIIIYNLFTYLSIATVPRLVVPSDRPGVCKWLHGTTGTRRWHVFPAWWRNWRGWGHQPTWWGRWVAMFYVQLKTTRNTFWIIVFIWNLQNIHNNIIINLKYYRLIKNYEEKNHFVMLHSEIFLSYMEQGFAL